jgi:hypothetical protein
MSLICFPCSALRSLSGFTFWSSSSRAPMAANFNVLTTTATDLAKLLSDGVLTSEQAVAEYLKQIETNNGYLHAVISTPPRDKILGFARELDNERSAGRVRGPLHGIRRQPRHGAS